MVSQPLYLQVRCKKNYEYSGWLLEFVSHTLVLLISVNGKCNSAVAVVGLTLKICPKLQPGKKNIFLVFYVFASTPICLLFLEVCVFYLLLKYLHTNLTQ
jgi:hypothetical protein